ncbi:hypothetical protein AB0K24_52890, partial [Streptomyces mirabilis]|uniref:hypothetical protein n=1 Tax=Streptomyces mirabilis TaxID=68239 RepID=UPI00342BFAF1
MPWRGAEQRRPLPAAEGDLGDGDVAGAGERLDEQGVRAVGARTTFLQVGFSGDNTTVQNVV